MICVVPGFLAVTSRLVGLIALTSAMVASPTLMRRMGRVVVSTRETAMKAKHLQRDPHVAICVITAGFFGEWVQVEGNAEIVHLPEAMDGLIDYYRNISGEHPDWDDYRAAMQREKRVLVKVTIERAGPSKSG